MSNEKNASGEIPVVSNHISSRIIGDEAFIMNLDIVKTYALNETASKIWSCIDGSTTVDKIIDILCDEYEIPREECSQAVWDSLNNFAEENLISFIDSDV